MGSTASCRGLCLMGCFLALLLPLVVLGKSCHKLKFRVPPVIQSGSVVGQISRKSCMYPNHVLGETNNPNFIVKKENSHYVIYSTKEVTMPHHAFSFGIILLDKVFFTEKIIQVKLVPEAKAGKTRHTRELLRRTKRRWRPMPFSVHENYRGKYPCYVETIQSDTQLEYTILYSITGSGVDQPPIGLFSINERTGQIYINGPVDREEYDSFQLIAYAKTPEGYAPESPLDLPVIVEDDNDNAPIFTEATFCAEILENSPADSVVGRVNATDRDKPGSAHVKLRYYLLGQIPPSPMMFYLNPETGIVTTASNRLDRETQDHYTLLLEVRDMDGKIGYLSSTGTMSITVLDANDFPPNFVKQSYQVEVNENESGMVILRIPIVDNDQPNTPNWRAVFSITQGNEQGHFNITTDPKTNEGMLSVIRPIDYEKNKQFLLQVGVANELSLVTQSGTKSRGVSTIPVTVIVKNIDEGPECRIKEASVAENQTAGVLVAENPTFDPETNSSSGIRYQIVSDPLFLVSIDANTGRITTAKVLDYEAKNIPTHQYNFTIVATDQSGKSGTCVITIKIKDVNDQTPSLPRSEFTVCQQGKTYTLIEVKADDSVPNGRPYTFSLDTTKDPTVVKYWSIGSLDGSTARIESIGDLPVGKYVVPIKMFDQQGFGSSQSLDITKCECADGINCSDLRSNNNVALGGLAILLMVLSALLVALFLCFLLACLCGSGAGISKAGFPDDGPQQNLLINNTEAPGADVMEGNFKVPVVMVNPDTVGVAPPGSLESGQNLTKMERVTHTKNTNVHTEVGGGRLTLPYARNGLHMTEGGRHTYGEWHSFVNTRLGDKLHMCGQDEELQHGEDYVVPYNYEGKGSMAGSVGCCSEFRGEDERMDFLNHLEPKFRTLAEVCAKK